MMKQKKKDDHCWWCDPDNISSTPQTRDHLFKHCSRWKDQNSCGQESRRRRGKEAEVASGGSLGG